MLRPVPTAIYISQIRFETKIVESKPKQLHLKQKQHVEVSISEEKSRGLNILCIFLKSSFHNFFEKK